MNRYRLLGIGLMLSSFLLCKAVESTVPQTLNYRGRLTDTSGAPVADGSVFVKFSLYDAATAGTELWKSGIQIVPTFDGLFSYNLGSSAPLPADLFLNNSSLYLGISIGTDTEISPRTMLTSSAFAYQALRSDSAQFSNNAALLEGKDASQFASDTAFSTHQSDSSSHHTKTTSALEITEGVFSLARLPVGTTSSEIAAGDHAHPLTGGNTFIHWGNQSAPTGSTLLYSGFSYGSFFSQAGALIPQIIQSGDPGPADLITNSLFYPIATSVQ